jgi:ubiquinone/menaquinone biosynthesis C-methylase UbiE
MIKKPIPQKTSWEPVQKWYKKSVGDEGHYYHRQIVIPGVLKILNAEKKQKILDLACGQGVLGRHINEESEYLGVDISPSLIKEAKSLDRISHHQYLVGDITKKLVITSKDFTHVTIILALQNIENTLKVIQNSNEHLQEGGKLILVLNHPCFRIPRQSSWQEDQEKKIQYRRMDRYLSSLTIPIKAHPSKENSEETLSFHHPLSFYVKTLKSCGFLIEDMEEWCSDKVSEGKKAKMENRAREEFPLFLTIVAKKII